ncbi:uncharacterized protein [Argopecten irradians]|uniref:uncharacterized protein n=1 Tax=Argopecten irradians TaxID=31199 RepID=UPI00371C6FED
MSAECTDKSSPSDPDLSTLTLGNSIKESKDQVDSLETNPRNLSPTSQGRLNHIVQLLQNQEAKIGMDAKGRPVMQYKDTAPPLNWDASNANVITTPKPEDHKRKVEAFLKLVEYLKQNKPPGGVNLDSSQISKSNWYEEGTEFEKTQKILGTGNSAGDIIVLKDLKKGIEHAQKTIMISVFRKEEIQAWFDLNETGIAPKLIQIRIEGNKVHIHMETLEKVVTLREVIDSHMQTIRSTNPALVRPFSLCVFHGVLSAIQTMHDKNWTHKDLHAGNILLQKESETFIKVRIVDFGLASKVDEKGGLDGIRSDIVEAVRKFTALYANQEFNSAGDLQSGDTWKNELSYATDILQTSLSREERTELFSLVDSSLAIVAAYQTQDVMKKLEEKMTKIDLDEVMKKVVPILFPPCDELFQPVHTHSKGHSSIDAMGGSKDVVDASSAATIENNDILRKLRLEMAIGSDLD